MNERLKKIESEALLFALKFSESLPGEFTPAEVELVFREVFAELIVRECDRYVAACFDECEPWMKPGDLLKHFGVQE